MSIVLALSRSGPAVVRLFLVAMLGVPAMAGPATALELSGMTAPDVTALQRRLTDAGCYTAAIDGRPSAAVTEALKSCPVMDPVLVIETGMHTAPIMRTDVDRACRLAATATHDKTVRLWSLPAGDLLRTLRVPIGPDNAGKAYATAVSPDGRLVAVGGSDARWPSYRSHSVYFFDSASGALKTRVGAFESVVNHLAFSADGRHVAVMLGDSKGLRVIDTLAMAVVALDRDYAERSYGAAFGPDGRLYTVAYDGFLRAYDRDFKLVKKVETRGGKLAYGVAVDPAGERVAVGHDDSTAIDVYRASDLAPLFATDTAGLTKGKNFYALSWSADGRKLLSGGRYNVQGDDKVWRHPLVTWDDGGRGRRHEQILATNTIMSILRCAGGYAVGAQDPLFVLLDAAGRVQKSRTAVAVDMRSKRGDGFQVSADGRLVRFGRGLGGTKPVLFDLPRATLTDGARAPGLASPRITGINVNDWMNSRTPKLADTALKLLQFETSRSLAIAPDAARFVLGTEWRLRTFDAKGRELWQKVAPNVAWGVNVTGDGRLVVAAYGDGTIRWHRLSDGRELLALFVHKDDLRWVAWTPSGYYMASPGAEDLIGWNLNRGWDQSADFFPASRFRERFSRPDVVQAILETLDEAKAIERTNEASRRSRDTTSMAARLPPVVVIVSPSAGTSFNGGSVEVTYTLRSPSGLVVDKVDVLINGRPVESRGLTRAEVKGEERRSVTVAVPSADAEIALIARSGELASEPARVRLSFQGAKPADLLKPKLYALVVGVGDYVDANMRLELAAKDARDFARALQSLKGGLYGDVVMRIAVDREATRAGIVEGLEWLEKQVTSRDVGVVFLAGHGVTDEKQNYWYLPADATASNLRSRAVSQDDLRRTLQGLAGKAMLFLDTCHAGRAAASQVSTRGVVDINRVVNEFASAENGVVTFASSMGREVSLERPEWGNGAFTKAIVEGLLDGRADLLGTGTVTVSQLDAYVANRVKELTDGAQHPVMTRPPTVADFPIAVVKQRR